MFAIKRVQALHIRDDEQDCDLEDEYKIYLKLNADNGALVRIQNYY